MNKTYKIAALIAGLIAGYAEGALAAHVRGPIELMRGLHLRGPILTRAVSASNQWAGRTTLASGSTSVTVSTQIVNSDSLINHGLQVALTAGYITGGTAAINSGLATATVSTTAVYSGQAISLSPLSPNNMTSGQAFRVDSIVNGVSFAIATTNGLNTVASGAVAMWNIPQAIPNAIKVNTINPKNHFIMGWADGAARPTDVTLMWEIRRTTMS